MFRKPVLLQELATTRPKLATTRLDMSVTAPTSDYWRKFSEEPEDFDAEKVWKYTSMYVSSKVERKPSLGVSLVPEEIFWSKLDQGALPPGSGYWTRNRPLPWMARSQPGSLRLFGH